MNYALDALWWRLTDPDVRALAAVLTAPALWHSGSELPVAALLGERGFRFLLELDSSSQTPAQPFGAGNAVRRQTGPLCRKPAGFVVNTRRTAVF